MRISLIMQEMSQPRLRFNNRPRRPQYRLKIPNDKPLYAGNLYTMGVITCVHNNQIITALLKAKAAIPYTYRTGNENL